MNEKFCYTIIGGWTANGDTQSFVLRRDVVLSHFSLNFNSSTE